MLYRTPSLPKESELGVKPMFIWVRLQGFPRDIISLSCISAIGLIFAAFGSHAPPQVLAVSDAVADGEWEVLQRDTAAAAVARTVNRNGFPPAVKDRRLMVRLAGIGLSIIDPSPQASTPRLAHLCVFKFWGMLQC